MQRPHIDHGEEYPVQDETGIQTVLNSSDLFGQESNTAHREILGEERLRAGIGGVDGFESDHPLRLDA